ncbi:MAG: hypothetical protein VXZ49_00150 [Planctomycetota bacterium]|nr:hypothetical protein [Planctomycetota bacterium]
MSLEASEISPPQKTTTPHNDFRRRSRAAVVGFVISLISLASHIDVRLAAIAPLASVFGVYGLISIRKYPNELTGVKLALIAVFAGPTLFVGSILFFQIKIRLEVPEGYSLMTWRELAPDEKTPLFPISEKARTYQGKMVYVRGYVYPSTRKNNLKKFILVRDSGTCCFGGQPKLTDMIVVDFVNEKRVDYSMWPRGLGGKFIVQVPERDFSGLKLGAYYLKADHLK